MITYIFDYAISQRFSADIARRRVEYRNCKWRTINRKYIVSKELNDYLLNSNE